MSGSLHAWYGLRDLESLAVRDVALSGELSLGKLTRLLSLLHSDLGSVRASLRFRQRGDGWVGSTLEYAASVQLVCQRCLEPYRQDLAGRVDIALADVESIPATVPLGYEPYEIEGERMQPAQLIEDELVMAIPLVPKHQSIADCGSLARSLAGPAGGLGTSETADR